MLPIHFGFVVAAQVLGIMMRITVLAIPVLIGGLCIINQWHLLSISLGAVLIMIVLAALYNALFFLCLAYYFSIPVLLGNVWPRFLSPLFAFGCALYPWRTVAAHSPCFSYILLCNPMTYCIEGLRSACLGSGNFLSVTSCVGVLGVVIAVLSVCVWICALRAVNPVLGKRSVL
jgi:hypothetical protein